MTSGNPSRRGRVLAEVLAIVSSILIAFAIQAWWEGAQEAQTARSHLLGVLGELQESRSEIDRYLALVDTSASATQQLLALSPIQARAASSDSIAYLLDRSLRAGSVTLPMGATEALIASGDLSLIDDKALSSRMAAWPASVRRAEQGGDVLRSLREEQIMPFLAGNSASLTVLKRSGYLDEYPDSHHAPEFRAMVADPRFEGHLALRGLRLAVTRGEYEALREELDGLTEALDSLLGG